MKEHPILFNSEMVRAILDGRKTQTRKIVKINPLHHFNQTGCKVYIEDARGRVHGEISGLKCPYGVPGDRLWVRETWATFKFLDNKKPSKIHQGIPQPKIWYIADNDSWDARNPSAAPSNCIGKIRPSIFMPKWACRLWLEVTAVRVERVQDISEGDALAEGITTGGSAMGHKFTAKEYFAGLWDSIYAKRGYSWESNPWAWVTEFKGTEQ